MISLRLVSGHVFPFVVVSVALQFPPVLPGNYYLRLQQEIVGCGVPLLSRKARHAPRHFETLGLWQEVEMGQRWC